MQRGRGGFTLVELLIVIAIIGILAAIAVPAFLGQREKAKARDIESSAKGSIPEIQSMLSASTIGEPFLILIAPSVEECVQYITPLPSRTCAALFPGVTTVTTYSNIADVINFFLIHHQSKGDKSPYLPTQQLFTSTDPTAGSITITNISDSTLLVRGYGETTTSLIFNASVSAR